MWRRLIVAAAALCALAPWAGAEQLETFVLAVGGHANGGGTYSCATSRVPDPSFMFFGSGGVGVPIDGIAECSLAGEVRHTTATLGVLADSTSLMTTFSPPTYTNSFTGWTAAHADYGRVGAMVHAEFTGPSSSSTFRGAHSFGLFRETGMIAASAGVPAGSAATVRFRFTVDGTLTVNVPQPYSSTSDVELMYQLDSGPIYILMRAQINDSVTTPFLTSGTGTGVNHFVLVPGSISGSGTFETFPLSITLGTPFSFNFGLLAYALPGPGAVNEVLFESTARLSSIELLVGGQPVDVFEITSDSGTRYDADGAHPPRNAVRHGRAWSMLE